ncbi:adenylate/guanylate cyclase domain-containing protein [Oceanibacterium hippocampi]|uniref:Adenylate cyclase 1 n=1 Tax=Oceanibacterium hippocampi TaxID=745714 RepID=A0A1Y5SLX6_9PROT|nr:adenylate/guanylate cyclase domain-containing protein [Oceanibacterium hippocampi]SLN43751.1 Adenylate cyclase 1 [Oceanibacterium hippocampi]
MATTESGIARANPPAIAAAVPAHDFAPDDWPVVDWLIRAGLGDADLATLFEGFCDKLLEVGLPVCRASIGMSTLHPLYRGYFYIWKRGESITEATQQLHSELPGEGWIHSPFHYMISNKLSHLRRRLAGPGAETDFPVLAEFARAGLTDWFANGFDLGWNHSQAARELLGAVATIATDCAEGFSDRDIERLNALLPVFALTVKSTETDRMTRTVLATYIGSRVADRVLSGEIRRGSVESMRAVLVFSDLQGFTALSDSLPRNELVPLLDDYLEALTRPIEARGGQVLKFMGDGVLSVFDLDDPADDDTCSNGLCAAIDCAEAIAALNAERRGKGLTVTEVDIAVHLGEVLYGNVGSEGRLDFTVIGPAVNEVSRMELLCQKLGERIVISEDFVSQSAADCRPALRSLGRHSLRGVAREAELFGINKGDGLSA